MDKYTTKKMLYEEIDHLMIRLDLTPDNYPLDSVTLANKYCINLKIEYLEFENLCGILYRGKTQTSMALNALQSQESQNFACMHELVHYFGHSKIEEFNCISIEDGSDSSIKQNSFMEWQANEGAAQALVPYQKFIPLYIQKCLENRPETIFCGTNNSLASIFNVSSSVIEYRIKSLKYEIYQIFIGKKRLNQLTILSNKKLIKYKLNQLEAEKLYCFHCFSVVSKADSYCKICGSKIKHFNIAKGLGYMIYEDEIPVNEETGRVGICPVCENDLTDSGNYCQICGAPIINKCIGNRNGNKSCESVQPGFARFCKECGSKTTFLVDGLLDKWQDAQEKMSQNANNKIIFDENDVPF